MNHKGNSVEGLVIAYIGGGSRGWAWNLMADLAMEGQLSGTVRLYDINAEAAQRNVVLGNKLTNRPEATGCWNYQYAASLEDALTGADFVICSILPGTFTEMASDVHEPEKYGIYQSVGDTVGPGGLMRALRTIPIYRDLALAIRHHCPQAWVINYTNPMSLCTWALYDTFPEIKAFGCCHEVFGTQDLLASMLETRHGTGKVPRQEIKVNVLGINHFTWLDQATWKGQDLFPLYRALVDECWETGIAPGNDGHWLNNFFASAHRVKFDLFRRYGLMAAAGDRHLAEFCPPWYLKNPETVKQWKFSLTPVAWRVENKAKLEARSLRLASGEEEMTLKVSGEEGILQIKAILGLGDLITNVNLPNVGQAVDLPLGCIVETNAVFGRDAVRPVVAGRLPAPVRALVTRHIHNQEAILLASKTRDQDLAFQAFCNDPLVQIPVDDARTLFQTMLSNIKAYLPE